jgi:nucleotide-binding universal stress UspA family protein
MKIVVAVDWSDEAFNAVQEVCKLYKPGELTLVHAVDLGFLESPVMAQAMNVQGYDEFRKAMMDGGKQLLAQTAALVPPAVTVKRVCDTGSPARIILDAARAASADLLVLGTRNRSRMAELLLGSVSHRVLMHATCPTLIVKRAVPALQKVLLAVEGPDDAAWLQIWLHTHPFNAPVELTVMTVVPRPTTLEPRVFPILEAWNETVMNSARELLDNVTAGLKGPLYGKVTPRLSEGNPVELIAQEAASHHVLVVGSHARKGVDRFLLGSVSHALSHRAACSVLVVR